MSSRNVELCLASPVLYPPRGGAEIRFQSYLTGLAERGINLRLLTGTPKAKKITAEDKAQPWYRSSPGSIIPTEPFSGVPIHRVRLPDKSGWRRVAFFNQAMLRYCRQAEPRPDLIQLIDPLSPIATPWLFKLKALGIGRLFAYTLPYELPDNYLKKTLRHNALRLLYRQLDCVITSSAETRAHALKLGLHTRFEVIPNGVNLQRFYPACDEEKRALKTSLGLGGMEMIMTTVGSIIPRKGIDLLLESWIHLAKQFPQLHFLLIGPRIDENDPKLSAFNQRLVDLVNASGAQNRVHFTGKVKNVESYLRASDLFVFASEREGMANVILEAMASGLPVVLTPHIGLPPDFGQPDHHYLMVERSADSISSMIGKLLNDKSLYSALARNGLEWVQETMDLEKVLDRYAAIYHELSRRSSA